MAKKTETENPQPERKLYPRDEAREKLGGISNVTLHKLINQGKLSTVKIGRRTFVTAAEIDRFISDLAGAA